VPDWRHLQLAEVGGAPLFTSPRLREKVGA
jgi:hypothetical protein